MTRPHRPARPSLLPLTLVAAACLTALSASLAAQDARVLKIARENAGENVKLAEWCRGQGLPAEAFRRGLEIDGKSEEVLEGVRSVEPRAVNSPGFYNQGTRTAYFFKGFLRDVVQGRGTPGLLEEVFGADLGGIEKGWIPFASETGK